MRKKEDCTALVEDKGRGSCEESETEEEEKQQQPHKMTASTKSPPIQRTGKSNNAEHTSSSSRLSLCRRVRAVVMGVILPIGKRRKGLNRSRICLGGSASKEDTSRLPKKVSFVFTERDALRKIVNRMIQVC